MHGVRGDHTVATLTAYSRKRGWFGCWVAAAQLLLRLQGRHRAEGPRPLAHLAAALAVCRVGALPEGVVAALGPRMRHISQCHLGRGQSAAQHISAPLCCRPRSAPAWHSPVQFQTPGQHPHPVLRLQRQVHASAFFLGLLLLLHPPPQSQRRCCSTCAPASCLAQRIHHQSPP